MIDSKNATIEGVRHETREIIVKLNPYDYNAFLLFISALKTKYFRFRASKANKPRTTGDKSQNHHLNGHIQQICVETGNDFATVKMYLKEKAIKRGYPFDTFKEKIIPWSEARVDTIQCGYLIEEAHQLAAELNIKLREK